MWIQATVELLCISLKSKEYIDDNAALWQERLKYKYEPIPAPSVVYLEHQFR
jgi:hypothetical protein